MSTKAVVSLLSQKATIIKEDPEWLNTGDSLHRILTDFDICFSCQTGLAHTGVLFL